MGKHKPKKTKISDNCRNVSASERMNSHSKEINRQGRPAKKDSGELVSQS